MRLLRAGTLFRDIPSSVPRAELLLFLSDVLLLAAPAFLATGILARPDPANDSALLLLWIAIPRALARFLAIFERPRDPIRLYLLSSLFVLVTTLLLVIGWEIVYLENRLHVPMGFGTAGAILVAWCSMLFLFHAPMYRLFDLFCGGVVVLGLMEEKPGAWIWVPLFFLALLFSATTRHILLDVIPGRRRPPINLHDGRVLSGAGALAAAAVFFPLYFALHGGFDFPDGGDLSEAARHHRHRPAALITARTGRRSATPAAGSSLSGTGEPESASRSGPQFSYRIPIISVASLPRDLREAWTVRLPDGAATPESWPPPASSLWRAATFASFDAANGYWEERKPLREGTWPESGTLPVTAAGDPRSAAAVELEYEVRIPIFRSLLGLHRQLSVTAPALSEFQQNDSGDVFPRPFIERGFRYRGASVAVAATEEELPREPAGGAHPDGQRYLEVPDAAALGVNLRRVARRVFTRSRDDRASIQSRIAALRRFFADPARPFFYDRDFVWLGTGKPFQDFLERTRTGNCTHYAITTLLLLRAEGVSTRFAVGFLGGTWDRRHETLSLPIAAAHAWVEVFLPGSGWFAIDPTHWITPARFPSDVAPSGTGATRGSGPVTASAPVDAGVDPFADRAGAGYQEPDTGDESPVFGPETAEWQPPEEEDLTLESETTDAQEDWFEFGDVPDVAGGFAGEAAGAEAWSASGGGTGEELADAPSVAPPTEGTAAAGPASAEAATRKAVRGMLRLALIVLAALAALALLVALWLKRRSDEEDEEEGAEEVEEEDVLLSPIDESVATDFDRSTPRGAVIWNYYELQRDLRRTRNHRRRHQTPLEHSRALGRRFENLAEPLRVAVRALYRALFSHHEVTGDEEHEQRNACQRVRRFF